MRHLFPSVLMALTTPAWAATFTPQDAAKHVGETAIVEGVAHVHVKGSTTFLDMGHDYPAQDFAAVIFPDHAAAFGDVKKYEGKTVAVTGKIRDYHGAPEIILDNPDQLRSH